MFFIPIVEILIGVVLIGGSVGAGTVNKVNTLKAGIICGVCVFVGFTLVIMGIGQIAIVH